MKNQQFDLVSCLHFIYKRKMFLFINTILISAAAIVVVFYYMKKEYSSKISFLPPTSESGFTIPSVMGISLPSIKSEGISADQFGVLFNSREIKKQIVYKFDLIENYKLQKDKNKIENAIKILNKNLLLDKEEKGSVGISSILSFTIVSYHTSPDTAKQMVDYTFSLLDSATRSISIDRARRNRKFIEKQTEINEIKLDSLQKIFQEFQVKNKAYDIPVQLKLSLQSYSELKATEVLNELKLKSLLGDFNGITPEIEELQSKQKILKKQLNLIETAQNSQVLTGLNKSTELLPEYLNILRSIELQNQVILLLTKELEQSKLQEAKNISNLIITDPSYVPEYKARPKRLLLLIAIVTVYIAALVSLIIIYEFIQQVFDKKEFITRITGRK